jgi:hypothetical protein
VRERERMEGAHNRTFLLSVSVPPSLSFLVMLKSVR